MIDNKSLKQRKELGIKIDHDMAFGGKSKGNRHLYRVVKLAKFLATKEKADIRIVEAAAWLHDTALPSGNDYDYQNNKKIALKLLKEIELPKKEKEFIAECVASHEGTVKRNALEAKIVHDADVLEKTGMLGIIRHTWKLTNLGHIDPKNISQNNVKEIEDHIKWRINQLETKSAKHIARKLIATIPTKDAKKIIEIISDLASKGIITEKIANKINPDLSKKNSQLLKMQLKQEYLK